MMVELWFLLTTVPSFASSGDFSSPVGNNSKYEPIPLLCDAHGGAPNPVREYKVGYAGRDTHPIRERMNQLMAHLPQYKFAINSESQSHKCV